MKPLEGVTVVDLSTFVAAPVCGRLLADLGARVIKVEAVRGDTWRGTGHTHVPDRYNKDENPVFDIYNTGKEFISLNLKSPEGKEAMLKLIGSADVFLTNTRPAALKRLGLAPEELREKFPGLVYAILLGYGERVLMRIIPPLTLPRSGPRAASSTTRPPAEMTLRPSTLPSVWAILSAVISCWLRSARHCCVRKRPVRAICFPPACSTMACLQRAQ